MNCPKCGYEIHEPLEECEHEVIDSGSGYNYEFSQEEYWFRAKIKCPKCGHDFEYSDSNL
jgi:uncharacterized Zn finger protein